MLSLKSTSKTFTASFGLTKTGKTVVVTVLDEDGVATVAGFTQGSVVELGAGTYGIKIDFSAVFSGYVKFNNTTDNIQLFVPFQVDNFDENIDTILTNTNKIPPRIKKNTALANFMFAMTDSTNHAPSTGLTVTATRSIDGAAFASCANAVSDVANGIYKISLAAGDLNGDVITLRFTAAASDDRLITIVTQE